ncbi:unnamed protein product [Oikopleura dioica]|uniref:G-protein coupled receptors family 1 profile domain-containing protein n=1 Tax=Oikopleura dioica TaxID=34765 RepID=E4X7H8_OIKDI|nr:unnamed protein product [Oikopleura dioica]
MIEFNIGNMSEAREDNDIATMAFCGPENWVLHWRIVRSILLFFVPLLIIISSYTTVYLKITMHMKKVNFKSAKAQEGILKLLIALMVSYIIAWMPYHTSKIYFMLDTDPTSVKHSLIRILIDPF